MSVVFSAPHQPEVAVPGRSAAGGRWTCEAQCHCGTSTDQRQDKLSTQSDGTSAATTSAHDSSSRRVLTILWSSRLHTVGIRRREPAWSVGRAHTYRPSRLPERRDHSHWKSRLAYIGQPVCPTASTRNQDQAGSEVTRTIRCMGRLAVPHTIGSEGSGDSRALLR